MAGVNATNSSAGTTTDATTDTKNEKTISQKANEANSTKTSRGTRIVKPGEGMDKNAFLRILSAELANQDPQNSKDGTEYVAQMAQFAGLEQMANLNGTMRLVGANALMGKSVTLKKLDEHGNLFNGLVLSVIKDGDAVKLNVLVGKEKNEKGELVNKFKQFDMSDIYETYDLNNIMDPLNSSAGILSASSLIGKTVEINVKDSKDKNYIGTLKEIFRDDTGIKVRVQVGESETKEFSLNEVIGVK